MQSVSFRSHYLSYFTVQYGIWHGSLNHANVTSKILYKMYKGVVYDPISDLIEKWFKYLHTHTNYCVILGAELHYRNVTVKIKDGSVALVIFPCLGKQKLVLFWQKSLIPWMITCYDQQLYQKRRSRWKERQNSHFSNSWPTKSPFYRTNFEQSSVYVMLVCAPSL